MFLQFEQIGRLRAAPAVNALVVVAHHAQIAMPRQVMDQFELRGVGVLVFVHHDVTVFLAAGLENVGMLGEEFERQQNQVVKIHRVAGAQGGFVAQLHVLGQRATFGSEKAAARSPPLRKRLNIARTAPGSALPPLVGNVAEDFFDRAQLLGLGVDDEIAFVAQRSMCCRKIRTHSE
jgi:hypothetical protein